MITVTSRQGLFDIALQHCGNAETAYDLAFDNGVSLTDDIAVGATFSNVPAAMNKDTVARYAAESIKPATAITTTEINNILETGEGIEFWRIELEFEVQ